MRNDLHAALRHDLAQLFELPLVHHEVIRLHDPLFELLEVRVVANEFLELRAAEAFGKARGEDDGAALFDDRQRADEALHGLVPCRIERVARATRDDDIALLRHARLHDFAAKRDAGFPRLNHVARTEPRHAALAVDADVDDEIATGFQRDPGILFVNGVAFEDAAIGFRVFEELRPVPDFHGFESGNSGADQLAPAAVTGHQVRFDQARRDLQFRRGVAVIDPDRHAHLGGAEVVVFVQNFAVMVDATIGFGDLLADEFDEFVAFVGAMQPRGDQDRDAIAWHPGGFERSQHRRQNQLVRHRPRDVANDDAGGLLALRQLEKRLRANRVRECRFENRNGIRERNRIANRQRRGDQPIRGQSHVQAGFAVVESHVHKCASGKECWDCYI